MCMYLCIITTTIIIIIIILILIRVVGRWLSWLRHWVGNPGDRGRNAVTAITFNCAAIHFPPLCITYIKGQFLAYHDYVVWEVKDPLSR